MIYLVVRNVIENGKEMTNETKNNYKEATMNDEQNEKPQYKMINVQVTVEKYEDKYDDGDEFEVPEQKFVIPVWFVSERVAKGLAAYVAELFPSYPPRITLEFTEKYKENGEYKQVKITLTEKQYNKLPRECDHCGRGCKH